MRCPSKNGGLPLAPVVLILGTLAFDPRLAHGETPRASCPLRLDALPSHQQIDCIRRLKRQPAVKPEAIAALGSLLTKSDGTTDDELIAAALDVLRRHPGTAAGLAETLAEFLPHRATIYQGRDKGTAVRLRAYLLVTLSDVGFPDSALPALVDTLAHLDERDSVLELAAAARVVGTLGARGRPLAPYLLTSFGERFAEEELSLERYQPLFPSREATTFQREASRSLGRVLAPEDEAGIELLQRLARSAETSLDPLVVHEARQALQAIATRNATSRGPGP